MPHTSIELSIHIDAPATHIWRIFSDPKFARQMGGEYVFHWKVGSSFGWKGLNGEMLTNGKILRIEPERLLQHSLFSPGTEDVVMATITYALQEESGTTTMEIREEFAKPITDEEQEDSVAGWNAALQAIKALTEQA